MYMLCVLRVFLHSEQTGRGLRNGWVKRRLYMYACPPDPYVSPKFCPSVTLIRVRSNASLHGNIIVMIYSWKFNIILSFRVTFVKEINQMLVLNFSSQH